MSGLNVADLTDLELKNLLDSHYALRNTEFELSFDKPDPLFAVKKNLTQNNIDEIAVLCALLAYGNAGQILKTLLKLDFRILGDKSAIKSANFPLYRFQTSEDIKNLFLAMSDIITQGGIKRIFMKAYLAQKNTNLAQNHATLRESKRKSKAKSKYDSIESPVICGINAMIDALFIALQNNNANLTQGLRFLIGQKAINPRTSSPLKRWNLFLRWVARKDNIDLGLWQNPQNAQDSLDKADLILPLDTHTFRLSKKLNLLQGKTYNLYSALEITRNLARFCADDPVKYDFALYRLGQKNCYKLSANRESKSQI